MDTVTIPSDEYLQLINLIDALKSKLSAYQVPDDKDCLPVVWAKKPDISALFSLTNEQTKLDLTQIRKAWTRKN